MRSLRIARKSRTCHEVKRRSLVKVSALALGVAICLGVVVNDYVSVAYAQVGQELSKDDTLLKQDHAQKKVAKSKEKASKHFDIEDFNINVEDARERALDRALNYAHLNVLPEELRSGKNAVPSVDNAKPRLEDDGYTIVSRDNNLEPLSDQELVEKLQEHRNQQQAALAAQVDQTSSPLAAQRARLSSARGAAKANLDEESKLMQGHNQLSMKSLQLRNFTDEQEEGKDNKLASHEQNKAAKIPEHHTEAEVYAITLESMANIGSHAASVIDAESAAQAAQDAAKIKASNERNQEALAAAKAQKEQALASHELGQSNGTGFFENVFGLGINDADARLVDDICVANSIYLKPSIMNSFKELSEQTDGSQRLLNTTRIKLTDDMIDHESQQDMFEQMHRGMSLVAYLLHMYTPQASRYEIPLYLIDPHKMSEQNVSVDIGHGVPAYRNTKNPEKNLPLYHLSLVRDLVHQDDDCAGLTYIEADLKGRCKTEQKYNGYLVFSMPIPDVAMEGTYTGLPRQITPNVLMSNFFAQGIDIGTRLAGLTTSYTNAKGGFSYPLRSFDKHLYSAHLKAFVTPDTKLEQLGVGCSRTRQDGNCQLYFVGSAVNKLLLPGNIESAFNLKAMSSLNVGTPDADVSAEAHTFREDHAQADVAHAKEQGDSTKSENITDKRFTSTLAADLYEQNVQAATKDSEHHVVDDAQVAQAKIAPIDTDAVAASAEATLDPSENADDDLVAQAQQRKEELQELARTAPNKIATVRGADGSEIELRQELYSIPVSFSPLGKPFLNLRNTLLSDDQYKNYTMLSELEMAVLRDIGYVIEPREFYGSSIYSFGRPGFRITRTVNRDYGFYDHKTGQYQIKKPSQVPLSIGLHVYGDYNDVIQTSKISSVGEGSLGVRIDGSYNYYYQTPKSSIITNGESSSGIGFTYGSRNDAYISGYVGALGSKGIGIKVDMGSNIYSDLIEYRGSYSRARTLDYLQGTASKAQASEVPLPKELVGAQVDNLIIDGVVEGNEAAIFIDESSYVKNIHVTADAVVNGGIYSTWNPAGLGSGKIILRHDSKNTRLLDAIVQLPRTEEMKGLTTRQIIDRYLTTNINLGVLLDEFNRPIGTEKDNVYVGNENSRVVISGDISGNSFNIRHFAGKSTILGNVRANKAIVYSGILSLSGPEGAINQIKSLQMRTNAILDLVNGASSHTYVSDSLKLGRNVIIRVDADSQGNLLDDISFNGKLSVTDYQLTIEPGVSYTDMRRLQADPKAMMNFIANFMINCNSRFVRDGIFLRFPHYIWDNGGSYGREIKCSARGCHVGAFASNALRNDVTDVETWRYVVSFTGLLIIILGFYAWYYTSWFHFKHTDTHPPKRN